MVSTTLAIYLGERYTMEKLARLLTQTLCLMMAAVIVLYFVAPTYVVDYSSHIGAWKGLSSHKNGFGEFMAEAVALLLLVRFRQFRWLRYLFLVAAVVLLKLSGSATSLFAGTLVIAAMLLWRCTRQKPKQRLLVYAVAALIVFSVAYFLTGHAGLVFQLLNRDPSLTGRTHIWAMALPAMMKSPILGYGYDAFWTGMNGEALDMMIGAGWLVPNAHNGFIDLGLSLGMLGLCVFLYVWASSMRRAVEFIRLEPRPVGLWPITYLCFFTLHNMTESSLLTWPLSVSYLLFAAITTSLAVNRRRVATAPHYAEQSATVAYEPHCAVPTAGRLEAFQ
jgi:O-antigen ligase